MLACRYTRDRTMYYAYSVMLGLCYENTMGIPRRYLGIPRKYLAHIGCDVPEDGCSLCWNEVDAEVFDDCDTILSWNVFLVVVYFPAVKSLKTRCREALKSCWEFSRLLQDSLRVHKEFLKNYWSSLQELSGRGNYCFVQSWWIRSVNRGSTGSALLSVLTGVPKVYTIIHPVAVSLDRILTGSPVPQW